MFKWLRGFFIPTYEHKPIDLILLANICFNLEQNGKSRCRIEDQGTVTKVFEEEGLDWKEVGELSSKLALLRSLRFATNSRACADLRLPRGEVDGEIQTPEINRYKVQITQDENHPKDFVEFTFERLGLKLDASASWCGG